MAFAFVGFRPAQTGLAPRDRYRSVGQPRPEPHPIEDDADDVVDVLTKLRNRSFDGLMILWLGSEGSVRLEPTGAVC